MKTFADPGQARHTPRFFLIRGEVRPNYEIPARAAALESPERASALSTESARARAPMKSARGEGERAAALIALLSQSLHEVVNKVCVLARR